MIGKEAAGFLGEEVVARADWEQKDNQDEGMEVGQGGHSTEP